MRRAAIVVVLLAWTLVVFAFGAWAGERPLAEAWSRGYVRGIELCERRHSR